MVSVPLCIALSATLCQDSVVSEDATQRSLPYSQVEGKQIEQIIEDILAPSYSRELPDLDTLEYVQGYYEYAEEQEAIRLAEEERERQYQEWLNSFNRRGYRQTYYSVTSDREKKLGSGYSYTSPEIKSIDNVMHYNDSEYGWLPVYAIDMDEVMASGQNKSGIWNLYGSVIEIKQGEETWLGIILDSCGACRYASKLDLWVYNNQIDLDISDLDWKYVRYGYERYKD